MRIARPPLLVVLLVASLAIGAGSAQSDPNATFGAPELETPDLAPLGLEASALEASLLAASNDARRQAGLEPLARDEGLARAARAHAAENARRGVLDHGSPDPERGTPSARAALAGVALVEVGENLARIPGGDVARRAVDGWLASPPHRRNLLDAAYTHVGFGASDGPDGTYLVQLFGSRPLTRTSADARTVAAALGRWTVDLHGPVGTDTVALLNGVATASARLGANGARLRLASETADARLEIGVAQPTGRHLLSDAGVLDADGRWSRDPAVPSGPVRVAEVAVDRRRSERIEVTLAYEDVDAPLRLFVDGRHLAGVAPVDGRLVARLASSANARVLAVGLDDGSGAARIVERFTLLPGAPPRLLPGRVPWDEEEGP